MSSQDTSDIFVDFMMCCVVDVGGINMRETKASFCFRIRVRLMLSPLCRIWKSSQPDRLGLALVVEQEQHLRIPVASDVVVSNVERSNVLKRAHIFYRLHSETTKEPWAERQL